MVLLRSEPSCSRACGGLPPSGILWMAAWSAPPPGSAWVRKAGATGRPASRPSTRARSIARRVDRQGGSATASRVTGEVGVGVGGRDHERLGQHAAVRTSPAGTASGTPATGARRVPGGEHQARRSARAPRRSPAGPRRADRGGRPPSARRCGPAVPSCPTTSHSRYACSTARYAARPTVSGRGSSRAGTPGARRCRRPPSSMSSRRPASAEIGEPVAQGLAPGREVGGDAVDLLGAARRPPHPGDHLVEDEHEAVRVGQLAQSLEEPGRRFGQAGRRLQDHARDLARVPVEQRRGRSSRSL